MSLCIPLNRFYVAKQLWVNIPYISYIPNIYTSSHISDYLPSLSLNDTIHGNNYDESASVVKKDFNLMDFINDIWNGILLTDDRKRKAYRSMHKQLMGKTNWRKRIRRQGFMTRAKCYNGRKIISKQRYKGRWQIGI